MLPDNKSHTPNIEQYAIEQASQQLFSAFEGYNRRAMAPEQLQWLVRRQQVFPIVSGAPEFTIETPNLMNKGINLTWYRSFKTIFPDYTTTERHSSNSPHIEPASVSNAAQLLTATWCHHNLGWEPFHDFLLARSDDGSVKPFWYDKRESPVHPNPLTSFEQISELLTTTARTGESEILIQIWKLQNRKKTYDLQVACNAYDISLQNVLRVLHMRPDQLPTR